MEDTERGEVMDMETTPAWAYWGRPILRNEKQVGEFVNLQDHKARQTWKNATFFYRYYNPGALEAHLKGK